MLLLLLLLLLLAVAVGQLNAVSCVRVQRCLRTKGLMRPRIAASRYLSMFLSMLSMF